MSLFLIEIGLELSLLFCAIGLLLCENERRKLK